MLIRIDIIILSLGKTDELRALTQNSIDSLLGSEDITNIEFNVLVIESNKDMAPYQYSGTTTIYPDTPFGYNKYMNIGIKATKNDYVCLCNNDLIFHKHWAGEILKAMKLDNNILSANPYAGDQYYSEKIVKNNNIILRSKNPDLDGGMTGWCIFVKREIFKKTGLLDEQFTFWYADNDYDMTLKQNKIEHALVKHSIVEHLAMQTHGLLPDKEKLTFGQRKVFDKKWNNQSLLYKAVHKLKIYFENV